MPFAALGAYIKQLPRLKVEYEMLLAGAAQFPYLDENGRRAKMRAWEEMSGASASERKYALNVETQMFEEI